MTALEQAQRDAQHARDELTKALCLLARLEANMAVDNKLLLATGFQSDERENAMTALREFRENFALYPPAVSDA